MRYLTLEEVLKIHETVIGLTGGFSGIISFGNLDFVIARSKLPRRIHVKAAVILYGIISTHPFIDGNKRTGFAAFETFLSVNGFDLRTTEEDIWRRLHKISKGEVGLRSISNWIKRKLVEK